MGLGAVRLKRCVDAGTSPVWLLLAGMLAAAPLPAGALSLVVESVAVDASGSTAVEGSFDISVKLGAGEIPQDVAAFMAAVDLSPAGSGVSFLDPFARLQEPSLITTNFVASGNAARAQGAADLPLDPGTAPALDGLILFQVPFRIEPGTQGIFDVKFDLDEFTGTLLVDGEGETIPFSVVDGRLTVVPEPGAGALLALGIALLARLSRRLRR
jgi:hypothetical protein